MGQKTQGMAGKYDLKQHQNLHIVFIVQYFLDSQVDVYVNILISYLTVFEKIS